MIDDRLKFYLEEAAKEAEFRLQPHHKNDPEERGWWQGRYLLAYTILKTWSPFSELKPPGDLGVTNWGAKYPPKTYPAGKSAQEPSPEPNPYLVSCCRKLSLLELMQAAMREPERTIVCDILANGQLLPDPTGERYGVIVEKKGIIFNWKPLPTATPEPGPEPIKENPLHSLFKEILQQEIKKALEKIREQLETQPKPNNVKPILIPAEWAEHLKEAMNK